MFNKLFRDSFILGLLLGFIPVTIGYFTFINYNELMENFNSIKYKFYPPRLQLVILVMSLVIFRFMMVKWNRIETGKGFFVTLFIATLIYFFLYRNKVF